MITYLTVTIAILLVLLIVWLYYRTAYFMYSAGTNDYYTFSKFLKRYYRGMKEIVLVIEWFLLVFFIAGVVLGIAYLVGLIIK